MGFPSGVSSKWCQCRRHKRPEFDPWAGKIPWRRAWQPLHYSCLENPMDRGAWWATVHRVAKSQSRLKQLSMHTFLPFINLDFCRIFVHCPDCYFLIFQAFYFTLKEKSKIGELSIWLSVGTGSNLRLSTETHH